MRSSTPRLHPTSRRCRNVVAGGENRTKCSMVKSWINGLYWGMVVNPWLGRLKGSFKSSKRDWTEKMIDYMYIYICIYTVYILYIYCIYIICIYTVYIIFICHIYIYIPYIYIHIPKISRFFPWWDGWPSPTIFWPWHRCGVWQKDHSKRTRRCPARSMELCNIMYLYIYIYVIYYI